jgi:hemolysin activation/secretion protein
VRVWHFFCRKNNKYVASALVPKDQQNGSQTDIQDTQKSMMMANSSINTYGERNFRRTLNL